MAFMERQIERGEFYVVETNNGTHFIPRDVVGDVVKFGKPLPLGKCYGALPKSNPLYKYIEDNSYITQVTRIEGYGARLSAPGYMDCTDWSVYDSEQEAIDALDDMYGEDDDN